MYVLLLLNDNVRDIDIHFFRSDDVVLIRGASLRRACVCRSLKHFTRLVASPFVLPDSDGTDIIIYLPAHYCGTPHH